MDINNLEKFKAKMASGRMCVGTVITLSDPAVSELAGDAGMDFTWIDAEHGPHTIESVMGHIMALRHKTYDVHGVQFHPESILTPQEKRVVENFINHR